MTSYTSIALQYNLNKHSPASPPASAQFIVKNIVLYCASRPLHSCSIPSATSINFPCIVPHGLPVQWQKDQPTFCLTVARNGNGLVFHFFYNDTSSVLTLIGSLSSLYSICK
eukprot:scaffold37805_cov254-Skeletonema_marinoi.AAC.3